MLFLLSIPSILVQQPLLLVPRCLRVRQSDMLDNTKSLALVDFLPNTYETSDFSFLITTFMDSDSLTLRRNYGLPIREVFINFAKELFKWEKNLDLLAYGGLNCQDGIPSWVPDWALTPLPINFPKPKYKESYDLNFSADAEVELNHRLEDNDALLQHPRHYCWSNYSIESEKPGKKINRQPRTLCQRAMYGWNSKSARPSHKQDQILARISNDSSDDESDDDYSGALDSTENVKDWKPSTVRDIEYMRHRRPIISRTSRL
ncbi:uncharacterized protein EAF01_003788 [Botrytis porri]|uniref:uncharacterized protein n=1 Tax=Botrytis porri TaxID=87229 RepID=UPI0019028F97|nr:uncharacterized protein EAF01_003788 [Botrytis porri]KAF7908033.1 hypothetical protein EAF01_003788 [Botrytis porri]